MRTVREFWTRRDGCRGGHDGEDGPVFSTWGYDNDPPHWSQSARTYGEWRPSRVLRRLLMEHWSNDSEKRVESASVYLEPTT